MLIHRQRGAPPKRSAVIVPVLAIVMLAGALLFSLLPINSAEAGQPTSISLSPTSGAPGSTFTVNGKGFPKRQSGQILWDASATDMPTFQTSGNGTFRVSGTVPSNAGLSPHTVKSAVGTISASAVYTVELVSPTPTATPTATPTSGGGGGGAVAPLGLGGSWSLVFSDEFDGTSLNSSKWVTCYGWWSAAGCTNAGNNELEWYQAANVSVSNGALHLTAKKETVAGTDGKTYNYTSGMVTSGGYQSPYVPPKFTYTYGFAEARAWMPKGKGLWPAFWTLPFDYSWPPEIDAMEILGDSTSTTHMNYHWPQRNQYGCNYSGPDFSAGWHVFGVDWEPSAIVWYVDGVERCRYATSSNITSMPQYVLLNLAVGGNWPGAPDASTPLPSTYDIDYVRIWQKAT